MLYYVSLLNKPHSKMTNYVIFINVCLSCNKNFRNKTWALPKWHKNQFHWASQWWRWQAHFFRRSFARGILIYFCHRLMIYIVKRNCKNRRKKITNNNFIYGCHVWAISKDKNVEQTKMKNVSKNAVLLVIFKS